METICVNGAFSGGSWLFVQGVPELIAETRGHACSFLAECEWTVGRAWTSSLAYKITVMFQVFEWSSSPSCFLKVCTIDQHRGSPSGQVLTGSVGFNDQCRL